jgi:hypothetical protein
LIFRSAISELLFFALPVSAGILAGQYVGRFVNFCVMLAVFQINLFILAFVGNGEFRPRLLIPVIFVWPPLSAGQFIPPLVFAVVSMVVYRVRRAVR